MAVFEMGIQGPTLPNPNGSLLEVSFRRLLESCLRHLQTLNNPTAATATDAIVEGDMGEATATAAGSSSSDGDETAARILKMRHYVETLRELLANLRSQQDELIHPGSLDAATLDLYDTHVKAVAAAVPKVQLPPYCQNLITGSAVAPGCSSSSNRPPVPSLMYFTPPPRPGLAATGGVREERSLRAVEGQAGLNSAASERLRGAEAAQALLTDDLADLTAALKANALGMAGAVADRERLLDTTDAALTDSLAAAKRNAMEASRQVKRSSGNFCFTCMSLLVVGLAFTAMVVYIKFTHLLGYQAAPAVRAVGIGAGWLGLGIGGGENGEDAATGNMWDGDGSGPAYGAAGQEHGAAWQQHGEL